MTQPTSSETRITLALEAVACLALLIAAGVQRANGGIQVELVLLGLLLLPAHLRRLLAWRELVPVAPRWAIALELAATAAIARQTVPPLALGLGVLAGLFGALHPGDPTGPVVKGGRVGVAVALVLAGLALGRDAALGEAASVLRLVLFAPLVLEALLPGDRSARAELRRGASALVLGAITLVREEVVELELLATLVAALTTVIALRLRNVAPAERPKAMRRLIIRTCAPVAVLFLFVAAGELAFRVIPNRWAGLLTPQEAEQPKHVPGGEYLHKGMVLQPTTEPENLVRWNRHGWHDVDHELARAPGVLRVLVLGDSYVEGVQVPVDTLYHRVLASELRARAGVEVEAIGYGWSGWGQRHELVALRDGQTDPELVQYPPGLAYEPDLVVVEFLPGNDVRNNTAELDDLGQREHSEATFARSLFVSSMRRRLFFNAMVWDKTDQLLRKLKGQVEYLDAEVYRARPRRYAEEWARAWEETDRLVGEIKALLEPRGTGLIVVGFDTPTEVEHARKGNPAADADALDPGYPHRRMAEICARRGVPYLSLAERFARLPDEERAEGVLHGRGDQHWTKLGHRRAAEATAGFLLEERSQWERALARSKR